MKSALKKLQYIENLIIVVSFAVMVTCSFLSVVNRNFIKLSIPWFDELSTFAMIYMALKRGLEMDHKLRSPRLSINSMESLKLFYRLLRKLLSQVFPLLFCTIAVIWQLYRLLQDNLRPLFIFRWQFHILHQLLVLPLLLAFKALPLLPCLFTLMS